MISKNLNNFGGKLIVFESSFLMSVQNVQISHNFGTPFCPVLLRFCIEVWSSDVGNANSPHIYTFSCKGRAKKIYFSLKQSCFYDFFQWNYRNNTNTKFLILHHLHRRSVVQGLHPTNLVHFINSFFHFFFRKNNFKYFDYFSSY